MQSSFYVHVSTRSIKRFIPKKLNSIPKKNKIPEHAYHEKYDSLLKIIDLHPSIEYIIGLSKLAYAPKGENLCKHSHEKWKHPKNHKGKINRVHTLLK